AGVGIYGVVAYTVTQRTQEIGIRIAMGATRVDVLRMILIDGAKVTCLGVVLGLGGALASTRVLASVLYDTSARDPITFGLISVVLVVVSVLAGVIPAWRASRVDPIFALRYN